LGTFDPDTNATVYRAYSQFLAGVFARVDANANEGFSQSPSNHVIQGVTGTELTISWSASNPTLSEANALNEVGIVTATSGPGPGVWVWGLANTSFPTVTDITQFHSVQRVTDRIKLDFVNLCVPFLGRKISQALIDQIKNAGNNYLAKLVGAGQILAGTITFDPTKNPPSVTSVGQLIFDLVYQPSAPLQNLEINQVLSVDLITFTA
jgi:hypothetical protein